MNQAVAEDIADSADSPAPNVARPVLSRPDAVPAKLPAYRLRLVIGCGIDDGEYTVTASVDQVEVGWLDIDQQYVAGVGWASQIDNVTVLPDWQRQGIATAMFHYFEQQTGLTLHHNTNDLSDAAQEWAASLSRRAISL